MTNTMCLNPSRSVFKIIALALLCFTSVTAHLEAAPVRIMVVGDSISVGYTDNPKWNQPFEFGFRSGLYKRLTNCGVAFQFVGSSPEPWDGRSGLPTNTPALDLRALGQDHCEGYGGKRTGYILNAIASALTNHAPDIVLLMIGINDIKAVAAEPVATERNLNNIVLTITTMAPNVRLIVAQITPYGTNCPGIVKYNAYIRNVLVPFFTVQGKHVTTVDQYSNMLVPGTTNISFALFSNAINHPNAVVYDRMAETWFKGIMALNLPLPKVLSQPSAQASNLPPPKVVSQPLPQASASPAPKMVNQISVQASNPSAPKVLNQPSAQASNPTLPKMVSQPLPQASNPPAPKVLNLPSVQASNPSPPKVFSQPLPPPPTNAPKQTN
jgi:hypothetical protein